jgi:hypothetical protein
MLFGCCYSLKTIRVRHTNPKQRAAVRPKRAYKYTLLQPDCASPAGKGQKSIMFTHSRILDKDIVRASYRKN